MERRKAITAAAAASLTLFAGAAGIALNSGIVARSGDGNVGHISPINTSNPPITAYAGAPATTEPMTAAPPVQRTSSPPVTTSSASGYPGDDHSEGGDAPDAHGAKNHNEYEGAQDDD